MEKRSRRPGPLARRRERWFYLLIAPWIIGFVVFQALPLLAALSLSFMNWPLPQPPRWVGLEHLRTLAHDPLVGKALVNTALYALGTVPPSLFVALCLAIILNRPWPGAALARTLILLPAVVSGLATAMVWGWLFNPRFGAVNAVLAAMGIHGPNWLQDRHWALPTLMLMSLWQVGTSVVIYVAALQDIPQELSDAAALDGAGRWARFRHITLPLLSPITFFLTVANTIAALQVFTPAFILTRGGPDYATLTLPLYLYLNAFSWGKLGYASAIGVLAFLATATLTWLQFSVGARFVFYRGRR